MEQLHKETKGLNTQVE